MSDAIAVIGMACRFPRASSPEAYWRLLTAGTEVVGEPPPDRPELEPPPWLVEQAPAARRGGFLDALDQFEPGFFRISPREAARMDPQQRLLLEVAWEALEDAGQPVARLSGTATGVFVGVMNADFARQHSRDLTQIDAQLGPGSSLGIAPNRISFVLDLRGPSMAIDTLCSSSLVAIHQACQSLLVDESSPVAIAGGVNVILDRTMDVFYARAGLLSKEGRCRAFDAGAGGIVRGEGCGLVVLKRLSRALADGDQIHAVIRGSAVNQDGRSNGLTSPSRWAQEEVLSTAYRRAGVAPNNVAYVEAHGTGTLIGDPIETAALGAVLGDGRTSSCAIGSVKTNLGHLESAAGVASLIKAVLSLEHRTLVPSLHFERANPYVRFDERRLRVPTTTQPWPGERLAGVSSFGMGGTNAHVVLAGVDETPAPRRTQRASLIPISARSLSALDVLEARTIEQLAIHDSGDVAHSLGARRDHHDHRRALVAFGTECAIASAGTVVPGRTHTLIFVVPDDVECDRSSADALAADELVFREEMQRALADGTSLLAAYQLGLEALWRSLGFTPDAVVHVTRATTQTLAAQLGEDSTVLVELSPRPILADVLRGILAQANAIGAVIPGLASRSSLLHAIGTLYCLGFDVDWRRLDAPDARFVRLGTYPWQRTSCGSPVPTPDVVATPIEVLVPRWERATAPPLEKTGDGPQCPSSRAWLVIGDHSATAPIVAALEGAGCRARGGTGDGPLFLQDNIVCLCGSDVAPIVRLVQALAARGDAARLWLVTRGACVVDGVSSGSSSSLASATAWGFGRVVMNEHPRLRCTLVDLSAPDGDVVPRGTYDEIEMLLRELGADDSEREVAIRGTTRYVARLERQTLASSRLQLRADAAYLVTGGLGGLGLAAARRLVERGARSLVLLGRRGVVTDEAREAIAALATRAKVVVESVDVADRDALVGVFQRHRVRGVIHAAGVMSPGMISAIEPEGMRSMLAAKVDGARHLHELGESLDFFVLYSSIATLLGMPGQGAYAAANAYLDALAAHRRARGLQAVSVAWTVIEGTGMAKHAGAKAIGQLHDRGVATLSIERATDLLEQVLDGAPAHLGAVNFDLQQWAAFYPHARSIARLAPLAVEVVQRTPVAQRPTVATDPHGRSIACAAPLAVEAPAEVVHQQVVGVASGRAASRSPAALEAYLCQTLATVLHDAAPDPQRPLTELGMDSLVVLELQEMLKADLGLEMPGERLLGKISIRELAAELAARLGGAPVARPGVSLRADAQLDPALAFTRRPRAEPRELLLTGATGFLGAFVLAELLAHTQARIHCLVRATTEAEAMRRLEVTLGRYDLPALDLAARVTCVPGDLAKPNLGLATEPAVDTIVHSGASVNFVYPYEALAADNVGGTREILRLAATTGARLHHVSTIGVFPGGQHRETVLETARSTEPDRLPLGYMRAKWVAEELVAQAAARGLDVSIYRPGTIAGHARSGAFNPDDFVCALIKGCVQLGIAPRVDAPINLAPVDYVARAVVRIALGDSSGTYHLVGRQPVAWGELVEWLQALGYPLRQLPYAEWRAVLVECAARTGNALAPLLPLFVEHETTDWLRLPSYDDARAEAALVGTGIACAPVDASLIRRYIERFVISGYLPRPRRPA